MNLAKGDTQKLLNVKFCSYHSKINFFQISKLRQEKTLLILQARVALISISFIFVFPIFIFRIIFCRLLLYLFGTTTWHNKQIIFKFSLNVLVNLIGFIKVNICCLAYFQNLFLVCFDVLYLCVCSSCSIVVSTSS